MSIKEKIMFSCVKQDKKNILTQWAERRGYDCNSDYADTKA